MLMVANVPNVISGDHFTACNDSAHDSHKLNVDEEGVQGAVIKLNLVRNFQTAFSSSYYALWCEIGPV